MNLSLVAINKTGMKKIVFFSFLMMFYFVDGQNTSNFSGETISFNTNDGVKVTADLYMTNKSNAPFIILYHQARYSRGEYREIAPKLNELGFNCLAVDQRSGKDVNGILNQTYLYAKKMNKSTEYIDAIPDLEAAFSYVKNKINPDKIILWGSSYSAALVFYLGSVHSQDIDGILAFSPGEYFKIEGKEIKLFAAKVKCPVFITSSGKEHKQWKGIYDMVSTKKYSFLPMMEEGRHGSKALWSDNGNHKKYWNDVTNFLLKMQVSRFELEYVD